MLCIVNNSPLVLLEIYNKSVQIGNKSSSFRPLPLQMPDALNNIIIIELCILELPKGKTLSRSLIFANYILLLLLARKLFDFKELTNRKRIANETQFFPAFAHQSLQHPKIISSMRLYGIINIRNLNE